MNAIPLPPPPETAALWRDRAVVLVRAGRLVPALVALGRAHRLDPGSLEIALERADFAARAGVPDAELARLGELAAAHPALAAPLAGQALLLHRLGRNDEAADALEAACALEPAAARLWSLLGGLLARAHRLPGAADAFARALSLDPEDHAARHDYGVVLFRMHRFAQAHRELRRVRAAQDDDPTLLCNLANAALCLGHHDEALGLARRAIAIAPGHHLAHRALVNTLPYVPSTTAPALLAALRTCSATLARRAAPPGFANAPDPERTLRVGLFGGMLKTHPVGWLTLAGFENLPPAKFELVGIAETVPDDPISRRFRAAARHWIEPAGKPDEQLAAAIAAAGIDILIDLGGYGDLGRMTACARRLAPVQVKWVGMQNHSTGLPEMDWFITDRWETPPDLAGAYSERLLVLPDGYACYSPPPDAPPVAALPMLARGHPTFGCFCNLAKVNDAVLAAWSAVLRAVPAARFVLKSHALAEADVAARILAGFARHGIGAERIELRGASPHRAFLAEWSDIDIALDTFPYSGGLTAVEALWMGVPTIALPGETFAARHSLSHLSNVGLADWAAGDVPSYVAQAVRRAADPLALAGLRAGLRERMRQSPLCNARRFGGHLGAALRHAWREWCSSHQIAGIAPQVAVTA